MKAIGEIFCLKQNRGEIGARIFVKLSFLMKISYIFNTCGKGEEELGGLLMNCDIVGL